jgi:colicin import membrane protein
MAETKTRNTCRYPGCERPTEPGVPGAGRPPEYCDDPDHNRASAWRARQRHDGAVIIEDARPVDAARQRASAITAQVTGMSEHLIAQLEALLGELRTVADPAAAEAQIEAVSSDAAEQIAAANSRAVRAEQALRKAISETEEADAAAAEATTRTETLSTELSQAQAQTNAARETNEGLRAAHDALAKDLADERERLRVSQDERARLDDALTQATQDLEAARQQAGAAETARAEADQRAAVAKERAGDEAVRAAAAEGVGVQLREHVAELREAVATLTAERDAARAEVDRERAHGEQRVRDLHDTYGRQLADLRTSTTPGVRD